MSNLTNAQNSANIIGQYNLGSSSPEGGSHLFVLENGDYAIAHFGGIQTGKWKIIKDNIFQFSPNIQECTFKLFGRHNKDIEGTTKISFNGFENAETFIFLGSEKEEKHKMQRVFNSGANCFSYPYMHTFKTIVNNISFAFIQYGNPSRSITTIKNPEGYNDFVANFIEVDSYAGQPFFVTFKDDRLYFEEDNSVERNPIDEDSEDIKSLKTMIDRETKKDTIYLNPKYNLFGWLDHQGNEEDLSQYYVFNAQKNAFIDTSYYVEGVEHSDSEESFNNMSITYRYKSLEGFIKKSATYKINEEALFQVSCD